MSRTSRVLAHFYLRLMIHNPFTWVVMSAVVLSTVLVSLDSVRTLQAERLPLQAFEAMLFLIFNNYLYIMFCLLFGFVFIVSTMFYIKESDRFILYRIRYRGEIWVGKCLAIIQTTALFLGAVFLTSFAVVAFHHPVKLTWSHTYAQMIEMVQKGSGELDPIYYIASPYIYNTFNPFVLLVLQALLFYLVFLVVGLCSVILFQSIKRPVLSLVFIVVYLFAWDIGSLLFVYHPLMFLTPPAHLLLFQHVPTGDVYISYTMSFSFWIPVLLLLITTGLFQTERMQLG
ncbi:MAG: hypothetical protein QHH75_15035 [Bacillota bacterium]|nr:hypothetical protein [Bacillota bacterium]